MNHEIVLTVLLISLICFLINIPFGMLRTRTRTFSVGWFLCVHTPVPVSALMRRSAEISYWYIPIFLIASIAGQQFGKFLVLFFISRKDGYKQKKLD